MTKRQQREQASKRAREMSKTPDEFTMATISRHAAAARPMRNRARYNRNEQRAQRQRGEW